MEKVGAVELLAVGLNHVDLVLCSLVNPDLINRVQPCPGEVSFSSNKESALDTLQCDSFIIICVL